MFWTEIFLPEENREAKKILEVNDTYKVPNITRFTRLLPKCRDEGTWCTVVLFTGYKRNSKNAIFGSYPYRCGLPNDAVAFVVIQVPGSNPNKLTHSLNKTWSQNRLSLLFVPFMGVLDTHSHVLRKSHIVLDSLLQWAKYQACLI